MTVLTTIEQRPAAPNKRTGAATPEVRALAFYLPQFHPIPENDEWWGKGFTEWRNVTRAQPLFPGHYQPHLPADLGFYDLRLPEVREAQAELARRYGLYGFCYYHYWFNGRRILQRPFDEVLASGKPHFPFCLCWANENWTRTWDGKHNHVLLEQKYNHEDDLAHIESLIPAFRDPRYIRINGRPLLLIYRTELLPDAKLTAEIWRQAVRRAGLGDLYLARVENFVAGGDPSSIGFDAAIEFAPDGRHMGKPKFRQGLAGLLSQSGILPRVYTKGRVLSYAAVANGMVSRPWPSFRRFRCVTPMWDSTARHKENARILVGSTPQLYEAWLKAIAEQTQERLQGEERIVFINAWNEWGEGCHLEPDLKWGHQYLAATKAALEAATTVAEAPKRNSRDTESAYPWVKQVYWRARALLAEQREMLDNIRSGRR